jgi:hypothetical protein
MNARILRLRLSVLTLAAGVLTSCTSSSGPEPPKPGSPAFNWAGAGTAYKKGDYFKANDLLVKLANGKSEFAERARPAALVTSLALANAYMEIGEKFAEGAKKTRKGDAPFRRYNGEYRAKTQAAAMTFIEEVRRYTDANKDKEVKIELELPPTVAEIPSQYLKIAAGNLVPEAEVQSMEQQIIQRELGKLLEKSLQVKAGGETTVPGQVFLLTMAKGLNGVGDMFSEKKLNQPSRVRAVIYEEAQEALALVKDNKEAAALSKKVAEAGKKVPKS